MAHVTHRPIPPEYVCARTVLLDALAAMEAHLDALVLVGAQAVYLHTGDANLSVAPTTTDADIALAPSRLADEPLLAEILLRAGFVPGENPGTWRGSGDVAIDLMVPAVLCPPGGRRGVRLPVHGNRVARRTPGLEAAIIDNYLREIVSFSADDNRRVTMRVAGPAALLVAKVIKIDERRQAPHRLKAKDGLDVLRLLQAMDIAVTAERLRMLVADPIAGDVTRNALAVLRRDGCRSDGLIPQLAANAMPTEDWETTTQSVAVLAGELMEMFEV